MKTIQATLDPAPPVVKFVANVWHQAHKRDATCISLTMDQGEFKLIVDDQVYDPPPARLFPHFVREFLRYSKTTVWPWTTRIKTRQCRVKAGNTCLDWFMQSDNIKSNLTIERDREHHPGA